VTTPAPGDGVVVPESRAKQGRSGKRVLWVLVHEKMVVKIVITEDSSTLLDAMSVVVQYQKIKQ